jgi:hypothetical protein
MKRKLYLLELICYGVIHTHGNIAHKAIFTSKKAAEQEKKYIENILLLCKKCTREEFIDAMPRSAMPLAVNIYSRCQSAFNAMVIITCLNSNDHINY